MSVMSDFPVTSARMRRWLSRMDSIRSMPSPSGRLTSPLPRMPRVTTPSKSSSTMRRMPSAQYASMAFRLRRKLHSPVPPYGSLPGSTMLPSASRLAGTAWRFHSSMPRIMGASCEVPMTMPYSLAVAWFSGSSSAKARPHTAGHR